MYIVSTVLEVARNFFWPDSLMAVFLKKRRKITTHVYYQQEYIEYEIKYVVAWCPPKGEALWYRIYTICGGT